MQTANAYLELIRERGKKGLSLERVYRQMFNRDLFLMAYGKIYRNKGAMTHGVPQETPDGISLEKIDRIIEALRYERYQWLPARRTYIPKKNGKKRPLEMPVWSDKLVQVGIRLVLEAYYEPQLSDHSHGFRPGRGCHCALREIYYNWHGTTWLIEGDISQCYDKLDHDRRNINGTIGLQVPKDVIEKKCEPYLRGQDAIHRAELVIDDRKFKGLRVSIPRQDKKPLVATWGGVLLSWDIKAPLEEQLPHVWTGRSELIQRLLADFCEICGRSEGVEVHHVQAMRKLHQYPGRPKPEWVKRMIALKRKTLLLCKTCHDAGRSTGGLSTNNYTHCPLG